MTEERDSGLGREVVERRSGMVEYIKEHGADLSFTKAFWKSCEPIPYELNRYSKYSEVLTLYQRGRSLTEISKKTGVGIGSVFSWTKFRQMPKLAHFLKVYLSLGSPLQGQSWLSVNNTSGHAIPLGPFIQVPQAVSNWGHVANVLSQLKPIQNSQLRFSKEYMFGFLLGIMIGDAAKSRQGEWHRHLGLVLSKRYATSERIGDFACECAQSVGLRMHRTADLRGGERKPNDFYEWVSQASPLIDWIFNRCLGLRDDELTTYHPIRMDWAITAPTNFKQGLIQGIAESDGSVSIASQTVEFWIGPNWDFMKKLLLTYGIRSFRNREALSVTKTEVPKLKDIPAFSPLLKTVRYQRFEKLANARHIQRGHRLSPEIRGFISESAGRHSIPRISEMTLDKFGIALSFEAVQRWAKKPI